MNLECLNDIISDGLAIHIDLTDIKSWDLNTGYTSISLTKWIGAYSDNLNLIDFGLTGFDNGRTNIMWSGVTFTPNDTLFTMYRVGYNEVNNPLSGNTGGLTATTRYDNYEMSGIIDNHVGNYFELDGGYLQGFFNLDGYDYNLLPYRYINGITIETLMLLYPDSQGIFYMMGARAEDKYNPFYSGEFISGVTTITGVTTSKDDYLEAFVENEVLKTGFRDFNEKYKIEYSETDPINNIKNNIIAFEITQDKRLGYKYIDGNGNVITNISDRVISTSGFTIIAISYKPYEIIDDISLIDCFERRTGDLVFYVNGRSIWKISDFPEYFFRSFENEPEKQLGVPYSISWGGGSFGLKHSYHYDNQTYGLYTGQNDEYINNNFIVRNNPLPTECDPNPANIELSGLTLTADTSTFIFIDPCEPNIEVPLTVMRVEYNPISGITGTTNNTYFVEFNNPISVLSNRDYVVNLSIYNDGFFNASNENKISIVVYGINDIDIVDDIEYIFPLSTTHLIEIEGLELYPFPDKQEYQYIKDGTMYYGKTGIPVYTNGRLNDEEDYYYAMTNQLRENYVTGEDQWIPLKSVFRTKDNTGQQFVNIGLLIETTSTFNENRPLYIHNLMYTGADILVQDERKQGLLIEQNFNTSFNGGIQKLRVYTKALSSTEILHNALIESKNNPNLNMLISKGGRLIYR